MELSKHLRRESSSDSDVSRIRPGQLPKEQVHVKAQSHLKGGRGKLG